MSKSQASIAIVLAALLASGLTAAVNWLAGPAVVPPEPRPEPAMVIVTDARGVRITDAGIEAVALKLAVGAWQVQAIPKPGDKGFTRQIVVSDSDVVIPPGPGPSPPVPVPPTPVVVEGKRSLLIVRETATTTPDFARLVNSLRNGPDAAYLESKGHTLAILDVDQQTEIVNQWRPHFAGMTLPALFIIDPATKQLVHKESIPAAATSASIVATVKGHGG